MGGGSVYLFANSSADIWLWTPSDNSVPSAWRQITWSVDTTAATAPAGWTHQDGTGSWASSWQHVNYWNFWTGGSMLPARPSPTASTRCRSRAVPEPSSILLLITGLLGLLAYAWRKRR